MNDAGATPAGETIRGHTTRFLHDGILRLALLVISERDSQRLLERAAAVIGAALEVEHVEFFELMPDGTTLLPRTSGGSGAAGASSQASHTLEVSGPVVSYDLRRETRFSTSQPELRNTASVPLHGRRTQAYGVLEVGSAELDAVSSEEVVDFLQAAGTLLVPAIERARADAACRFVAESAPGLVSSLDPGETLAVLAELTVPRLAGWCCADALEADGTIASVAVVHSDPLRADLVSALRARIPPDPGAAFGISNVLRTGRSEFHLDLAASLSAGPSQVQEVRELAEAAGFTATIVVPLTARGHIFATLALVATEPTRAFDMGDLALAETFAAHGALAIDNVRLFGRQGESLTGLGTEQDGIALLNGDGLVRKRLLSAATEEARHLARTVDGVVFASELSLRDPTRPGEACDAAAVARGVIESARDDLPEGSSLELDEIEAPVACDAASLRRILAGLVDNAVRRAGEGEPISVGLEVRRAGLRLTVTDQGPGVAPAERERIFEKFYRGERERAAGAPGAGVGLYVCRELTCRLDGHIGIAEASARGTSFFVELPLADRSEGRSGT